MPEDSKPIVSAQTIVDRPGRESRANPGELPRGGARYETRGTLGAGGMGVVQEVRDARLGRDVALKRMLEDVADDAKVRFLREAQLQARLEHPCVVPVYDLELDADSQPFFTMKRVRGVTLREVLHALSSSNSDMRARWTRRKLLSALSTICLAVDYAHERGVVHRDLKPDNIMLGDFGEVYVLDWGIAQLDLDAGARPIERPAAATMTGPVVGTPGYAAPEQLRGDHGATGPWSDVYALGVILFEILALRRLHDGATTDERIASALRGVDVAHTLVAIDSEVAPELVTICTRAVADDPDRRYASARDMQEAIERFLDGDRDIELRRELAREALGAAQKAIARGDRAADRSVAIRAAARALALDPYATEPAELVGRLMIEPPADVPDEVDRELAALEADELRTSVSRSSLAISSVFVFLPILYWAGLREPWQLFGMAGFVVLYLAMAFLFARGRVAYRYVAFPVYCGFIAVLALSTSPFLVAPAAAASGAMSLSMHPRSVPALALVAGATAAVLLPWGASLVGLVEPSTSVIGNTMILHTASAGLNTAAVMIGLVLYVVVIIAIAVWLPRRMALEKQANRRSLHLQAWQLRQLVPSRAA